jgi:hypothetical protein
MRNANSIFYAGAIGLKANMLLVANIKSLKQSLNLIAMQLPWCFTVVNQEPELNARIGNG